MSDSPSRFVRNVLDLALFAAPSGMVMAMHCETLGLMRGLMRSAQICVVNPKFGLSARQVLLLG